MDWNGAFFSLMAVVAQTEFDVLGGVLYIIWYVPTRTHHPLNNAVELNS